MSRENVELIREACEHGLEDPEGFFAIMDADVSWESQLVDSKPTRGVDALREFFRHWVGAFREITFEWEELIDAGEDQVVTIGRWWGTGKSSGAPVAIHLVQVWTLRDGKVIRCRDYADRAQALLAAGVSGTAS